MSRVTEIRYVGYGVQDFEAERRFYAEQWGLVEVASEEGAAWFKTHGSDEHHVVRLHRAPVSHVEVMALAAGGPADVDALHGRLERALAQLHHAVVEAHPDWTGQRNLHAATGVERDPVLPMVAERFAIDAGSGRRVRLEAEDRERRLDEEVS